MVQGHGIGQYYPRNSEDQAKSKRSQVEMIHEFSVLPWPAVASGGSGMALQATTTIDIVPLPRHWRIDLPRNTPRTALAGGLKHDNEIDALCS